MSDWTPEAQRRWEHFPDAIQQRLLAQVWCSQCGEPRRMILVGGAVVAGDLVLTGTCAAYGHRVVRLLEDEPQMQPTAAKPDFQPGDEVIWLKRLPGGAYVVPLTARVLGCTAKRVKIVADDDGQKVTRFVPIESLERSA